MATALTQTTLSAAITAKQTVIPLTSVTGITAGDVTAGTVGSMLWVVDPGQRMGEPMNVLSISGTNVTVSRMPGKVVAHISGAMVLAGPPNAFKKGAPTGSTDSDYTPYVDTETGDQWLYSSVTGCWVPGFRNCSAPPSATATVASAAGLITPSGPLLSVSGTAAITGFTVPVGGIGASFSIIPTGNFTFTTANNIGLAGTAVTGRVLTFIYDTSAAKYYPSYV